MLPDEINEFLFAHRNSFAAASSSLISTFAGYPLDAVKSRLQVKSYSSIHECIRRTYLEEGVQGFFRGLGIPLLTITIVRTTSFSIYDFTKTRLREKYQLPMNATNTAALGFVGGATGGVMISFGSCAFELAKVRAQLEYIIAQRRGVPYVPSGTVRGAVQIYKTAGIRGLYFGFPLHLTRDTLGSGLYFMSYDSLRRITRERYPEKLPFGLPAIAAPFLCGSSAGIFSWMLIYPIDLVKTRVQRDALEGVNPRPSAWAIYRHLSSKGFTRLYRGLGISAFRSMFTHGLQWVLLENVSTRIAERHQILYPVGVEQVQ